MKKSDVSKFFAANWDDWYIPMSTLLLLFLVSYWITLALATISLNPLDFKKEVLLPFTIVVAGFLVWHRRRFQAQREPAENLPRLIDPLSSTQDTWSISQILRHELSQAKPDLWWVMAGTTVIFVLFWLGWGIGTGADGLAHIINYLQLNDSDPVYYFQQVYWTPLTGLFYGGLLETGGRASVVAGQLAQALLTGCGLFLTVRPWGRGAAWIAMILWWTYFSQQVFLHLIAAESMMVVSIVYWMLAVRLAVHYQRPGLWLLVGLVIGINVLIRPSNLVLGGSLIGSVLVFRNRARFVRCAVGGALGVILLAVPYILYNGIRYDQFTLARGGNTLWFTATYINKTFVAPENGRASQKFAVLVEENLLTTPPYEGITLEQFFAKGTFRTHSDSVALIDRTEGWDTEYQLLRDVGLEAVKAHPRQFIQRVISDFARLLVSKEGLAAYENPAEETESSNDELTVTSDIVEQSYVNFLASNPSGLPPDRERLEAMRRQFDAYITPITTIDSHPRIADALGQIWIRFGLHPLVFWLFAIPLALWRLPGKSRVFVILALLGMLSIIFPSSLVYLQLRYRLPLETIYIVILSLVIMPPQQDSAEDSI